MGSDVHFWCVWRQLLCTHIYTNKQVFKKNKNLNKQKCQHWLVLSKVMKPHPLMRSYGNGSSWATSSAFIWRIDSLFLPQMSADFCIFQEQILEDFFCHSLFIQKHLPASASCCLRLPSHQISHHSDTKNALRLFCLHSYHQLHRN